MDNQFLSKLLESEILDEDTKVQVKEAFEQAITAAKEEAKDELSERYERDRARLVEALHSMVSDRLDAELGEFAQDHKAARKMAAKAAKAISEADARATAKLKKQAAVLEAMVSDRLDAELTELHEDRQTERSAVVKQLKETKAKAAEDREKFIKKSARVLETIVSENLNAKLEELHEDIVAARRNDFGRKVFEAFAAEWKVSFLNENAEVRKLENKITELSKEVAATKQARIAESKKLKARAVRAEAEANALKESTKRKEVTKELLSRLDNPADQAQMKVFLESAKTSDLRSTFRKYLPEVLSESRGKTGGARKRAPINESKTNGRMTLKTGSKKARIVENNQQIDPDIANLKRLSGLGS